MPSKSSSSRTKIIPLSLAALTLTTGLGVTQAHAEFEPSDWPVQEWQFAGVLDRWKEGESIVMTPTNAIVNSPHFSQSGRVPENLFVTYHQEISQANGHDTARGWGIVEYGLKRTDFQETETMDNYLTHAVANRSSTSSMSLNYNAWQYRGLTSRLTNNAQVSQVVPPGVAANTPYYPETVFTDLTPNDGVFEGTVPLTAPQDGSHAQDGSYIKTAFKSVDGGALDVHNLTATYPNGTKLAVSQGSGELILVGAKPGTYTGVVKLELSQYLPDYRIFVDGQPTRPTNIGTVKTIDVPFSITVEASSFDTSGWDVNLTKDYVSSPHTYFSSTDQALSHESKLTVSAGSSETATPRFTAIEDGKKADATPEERQIGEIAEHSPMTLDSRYTYGRDGFSGTDGYKIVNQVPSWVTVDPTTGVVTVDAPADAQEQEIVVELERKGLDMIGGHPLNHSDPRFEGNFFPSISPENIYSEAGYLESQGVREDFADVGGSLVARYDMITGMYASKIQRESFTIRVTQATEPIEPGTRYVEDPTAPVGQVVSETPGTPGERNPNTGEVITPAVDRVITVGTAPTVTTAPVPFETQVTEDPTLPAGQRVVDVVGVPGEERTTITYSVDPATGAVTPNPATTERTLEPVTQVERVGVGANTPVPFETVYVEDPTAPVGSQTEETPGTPGEQDATGKVITPPTNRVVKVGTAPIVVETPTPFQTEITEDPTLPAGERVVDVVGVPGKTVTTTTYTVDPTTGLVTGTTTTQVTDPVTQKERVGTKAETPDVPVLPGTRYVADPDLPYGQSEEEDPGTPGLKDGDTGELITPPTDRVVRVGTAPVVTETPIPFQTDITEDPSLPAGERVVDAVGVPGKSVTTTTFTVDDKTGAITPVSKTVTTDPVTQKERVGTYSEQEVPYHTIYVEDPTAPAGSQTEETPGVPGTRNPATGEVITPATPRVVKVGTAPVVTETPIPFQTDITEDPTLPAGERVVDVVGVPGKTVTTTSYTLDPATGLVTPVTKSQTTDPVTQKERIGTQVETPAEPVLPGTKFIADPEAPVGSQVEENPGTPGTRDPKTGELITPPVDRVIKVGTKPTVTTSPIPFQTELTEDPTLPAGQRVVDVVGVPGESVTTTTYIVDEVTGAVTPVVETVVTDPVTQKERIGTGSNTEVPYKSIYKPNPDLPTGSVKVVTPGTPGVVGPDGKVITPPVDRVVEVGTAPIAVTTPLDFETEYIEDPTMDEGTERVEREGEKGSVVVTTHFEVDPETGEVVVSETTREVTDPVNKVIRKGTKKVETPVEPTPEPEAPEAPAEPEAPVTETPKAPAEPEAPAQVTPAPAPVVSTPVAPAPAITVTPASPAVTVTPNQAPVTPVVVAPTQSAPAASAKPAQLAQTGAEMSALIAGGGLLASGLTLMGLARRRKTQ